MNKIIASITALIAILVLYLGVSALFTVSRNPIFVVLDSVCIGVGAILLVSLIKEMGQGLSKSSKPAIAAKRLASGLSLLN